MLDYANHRWFFLFWIGFRNNTKSDLHIRHLWKSVRFLRLTFKTLYNLMKIDVWFWPIPPSIQHFVGDCGLTFCYLKLPSHYSTTWVALPFPVHTNLSILQSEDLLNWLCIQSLYTARAQSIFVEGLNRSIVE